PSVQVVIDRGRLRPSRSASRRSGGRWAGCGMGAGRRGSPRGMNIADVTIDLADASLPGDLALPDDPAGVVLFAHGSGSSRHSPRNRAVAAGLNDAGIGTLLIDLLTEEEGRADAVTGELR